MAFYLVTARPRPELLEELRARLERGEVRAMRPFGAALDYGLANARVLGDGTAAWEEEDHCRPPLAEERAAVLDRFFGEIRVAPVSRGFGWARLRGREPLFPGLGGGGEAGTLPP